MLSIEQQRLFSVESACSSSVLCTDADFVSIMKLSLTMSYDHVDVAGYFRIFRHKKLPESGRL